jgi:hypothetical protein
MAGRHMIKLGLCATASFVTFFDGLSAGVALAAVPNTTAVNDDPVWLRRDMFEAQINKNFVVHTAPSGSITVRLMRVTDVLSARNAGTVNHPDCFMAEFRGARSSKLAQGTYRVESAALGTFLLFLVPGATDATHITYTATFNRVGPV